MIGEIDFLGIFVPAPLVLMLIAYFVNSAIGRVLERTGFYRFIWHRSLFDLGIYFVVLASSVFLSHRMVAI